jgi:hypothetical protein
MLFGQTIPTSTQASDTSRQQGRSSRSTTAADRTACLRTLTFLATLLLLTLSCCNPLPIQGQPLHHPATQEAEPSTAATEEPPTSTPAAWEVTTPPLTVALLIDEAADYYGLTDWERARAHSIAVCESGETADAYNRRSGAAGAFQFIPSTARNLGIDPWNAYQNVYTAIGLMAGNQWQHWAACDPFAYTYRRR